MLWATMASMVNVVSATITTIVPRCGPGYHLRPEAMQPELNKHAARHDRDRIVTFGRSPARRPGVCIRWGTLPRGWR
jgi:hypothetical protein